MRAKTVKQMCYHVLICVEALMSVKYNFDIYFFSLGRLGIRLKMHGIYLRDKIRFCKAILVLQRKSRFFLKMNLSQYTLGSEYTRDLFTMCENS